MVHGDLFGPWGRILIVVVAALAIVLLLLVIACFLTPGCLGYECVKRSKPCRLRPNAYRVITSNIAILTSFDPYARVSRSRLKRQVAKFLKFHSRAACLEVVRFVAAAELLEYRHVSFIEIYQFIRAYFIFATRSISDSNVDLAKRRGSTSRPWSGDRLLYRTNTPSLRNEDVARHSASFCRLSELAARQLVSVLSVD